MALSVPYGEVRAVCRGRIPSYVQQQTSAVVPATPYRLCSRARAAPSSGPDAGPAADRRRLRQPMAVPQSRACGRVRLQRASQRLARRPAAPVGRSGGGEQHSSSGADSGAGRGGPPSPDKRQGWRTVTAQQEARRLSFCGHRGQMAAVRVFASQRAQPPATSRG